MKKIIIKINQEQADYLQRLGVEVDSKVFLMDRIFDNHSKDADLSIIDSKLFKYYTKEYEEAFLEFELAKRKFQNDFLDAEVQKALNTTEKVSYTWNIEDYLALECEVTID